MQTVWEQEFDEQQLEEVILDAEKPYRTVKIRASFFPDVREHVIEFFASNSDYFSWSHEDVTGTETNLITQKPNVNPHHI